MSESKNLVYRTATETDAESIATLVNGSYFGEESNQGWTNQNGMVTGKKTSAESISNMMVNGKGVFLMFFGETDHILKGSIHLIYNQESNSAYLGMFSVRPDLQAQGYGKFILSTAENYAISNWHVDYIKLRVIMQRPELIAYYVRRGYSDTGFREPFPKENLKLTTLLRSDLNVGTMSKCVNKG